MGIADVFTKEPEMLITVTRTNKQTGTNGNGAYGIASLDPGCV